MILVYCGVAFAGATLAFIVYALFKIYRRDRKEKALDAELDRALQRSGPKRILRISHGEIIDLLEKGPLLRSTLLRSRLRQAGFDMNAEILEEDRSYMLGRIYYQDIRPVTGEPLVAIIPNGTPTAKAEALLQDFGFNLDRRLNSSRIEGGVRYWQPYFPPGKKV